VVEDSSALPFRRRDVSAMVVANVLCEKNVFLKYFEGYTRNDVCFISVFVVIQMASDQCSFPPSGFWKNLVRRDQVCK